MKKNVLVILLFASISVFSQNKIINEIVEEATNNSQLEKLAHELLDVVGPRLVGTPQMKHAHDWAVDKYTKWEISARNHQWGEWRGWERGITHVDMIEPRIRTLSGMQLAWSPSTSKRGIKGGIAIIPKVKNPEEFKNWLKTIKGKFILTSMYQITGRPDYNWKEYATTESFDKMKRERDEISINWYANLRNTGYDRRNINQTFEDAWKTFVFCYGSSAIINAISDFGPSVIFTLFYNIDFISTTRAMFISPNFPSFRVFKHSLRISMAVRIYCLFSIRDIIKRIVFRDCSIIINPVYFSSI